MMAKWLVYLLTCKSPLTAMLLPSQRAYAPPGRRIQKNTPITHARQQQHRPRLQPCWSASQSPDATDSLGWRRFAIAAITAALASGLSFSSDAARAELIALEQPRWGSWAARGGGRSCMHHEDAPLHTLLCALISSTGMKMAMCSLGGIALRGSWWRTTGGGGCLFIAALITCS